MAHRLLLMVDHNVMRLDIAMHYSLGVAEIQSLQQLVYVVPYIIVNKLRVQRPEIRVVDILEY